MKASLKTFSFVGTFLCLAVWTLLSSGCGSSSGAGGLASNTVEADNKDFQYTGRIDFSNPKRPKFSAPGVYIQAAFQGTSCAVVINDQVLSGTAHNYLEVVIDDKAPLRVQTKQASNVIPVATGLPDGTHTITVCKDTESSVGTLEFVGLQCAGLVPLPSPPARKMEFIGDSITCGTGSDTSVASCSQGRWYDHSNAYLDYGPTTARDLHARWQLTAASGIGLQRSCCGLTVTLPDVFNKIDLRTNTGVWDFARYQPDAVAVCLGQNDGIGDPPSFERAYEHFLLQVRADYPNAEIFCLSSPIAVAAQNAWLQERLTHIVAQEHGQGDEKVQSFFFARRYGGGCDGHPTVAEHQMIAKELSADIQSVMGW